MKAVRCVGRHAHVVDLPEPRGEGVRVHIASAGICGSDLHLLGSPLLTGTLGHEFAGWLDDGTAVAVEPLDPCWRCSACVQGDYHRCTRWPAAVLGVGRDGGMAESCVVPSAALVPLATGLAPRDACLVEPLAVAVHGLRRAARLLAAHPEIATALITHRFPLDAAAHAFAVARDRAAGAIKVVLEP